MKAMNYNDDVLYNFSKFSWLLLCNIFELDEPIVSLFYLSFGRTSFRVDQKTQYSSCEATLCIDSNAMGIWTMQQLFW